MTTGSGAGQRAAIGCRAHTGWASIVVVAGGFDRPDVVLRRRVELGDPTGRVRRNAYHAARGLELVAAAELVRAAERIARDQAAAALEQVAREARHEGADVRSCAVVVGASSEARLESILASHALAHAAEGRLYQRALLQGAEARGLDAVTVAKRSIWEQAASALRVTPSELRERIDGLRRQVGPPWAEDQKLAAIAAWAALA